MAQPQQQQQQFPPSRPYASPHGTPSPAPGATAAFTAPPIKRPQNSPSSPASPYPPLHSPPNGLASFQSNPYASQGSNPYPLPPNHATSPITTQPLVRQTPPPPHAQAPPQLQMQPQMQFQPAQQAAPNVMGPPPTRPDDDKPMDLNDIQDVMTGSGIDLKAEEAALNYDGGGRRQNNVSSGPPQGYFDPQRNTLQLNIPGGRDSFYGSGPFNQPASATSPQDMEDELEAREKLMIRRRNERDQYHSNNPFLQNRIVLQRVDAAGKKSQTPVNMEGVYHPQRPITTTLLITGPDGQERLATLTKEPLLTTSAPMVDILSLLSLACRERLRTVLEESASLARGRRLTAGGVVPPDFQDIAVGQGKASEATAESMPLIGTDLASVSPRKRSHWQANQSPTPVSQADREEETASKPTIAYPDLIVLALQKQVEESNEFEREREAKRQKRSVNNHLNGYEAGSRAGSISGTPTPGTPGPIDGTAPEQQKLTKKEQKKREELQSQMTAAKDTRTAVNMALGGKKFSWMNPGGKGGGGGGGAGGTGAGSSFGKKTPAGTPAKKQAEPVPVASTPAAGPSPAPTGATVRGNRVLGTLREDREDGRGIQMRDLISVLSEGHEKKTLSKSYNRLK